MEKSIAIASSDAALDRAIKLLFQDSYHIYDIKLSEQLSVSLKDKFLDLLIIDLKSIDFENLKIVTLLKKMNVNLPIIMLYDLKIPDQLKTDLFQLADVMLRKPFSNKQLINSVSSFLNNNEN